MLQPRLQTHWDASRSMPLQRQRKLSVHPFRRCINGGGQRLVEREHNHRGESHRSILLSSDRAVVFTATITGTGGPTPTGNVILCRRHSRRHRNGSSEWRFTGSVCYVCADRRGSHSITAMYAWKCKLCGLDVACADAGCERFDRYRHHDDSCFIGQSVFSWTIGRLLCIRWSELAAILRRPLEP